MRTILTLPFACLLTTLFFRPSESSWSRRPRTASRLSVIGGNGPQERQQFYNIAWRASLLLRGGGGDDNDIRTTPATHDDDDDDEERYSRQVYTLGAKAHGRIRSTTVYLDGPPESGLMYEVAKNLALSGIRRIVLIRSVEDNNNNKERLLADRNYHEARLDDLGRGYQRAARAELLMTPENNNNSNKDEESADQVLMEYIQRLNPSVLVTAVDDRKDIPSSNDDDDSSRSTSRRVVLVSVDRPFATQVSLNNLARQHGIAFVSVETAGVFGRIFCDFGSSFEVYDADGETPLVTPFESIEEMNGKLVVRCVSGEKHDVSKGDKIQFQLRDGTLSDDDVCIVTNVENPFRFQVELVMDSSQKGDVNDILLRINQHAASFRRIKVPQHISYEPLHVAIEQAKKDSSLFTPCDLDKSFDNVRRSVSFSCFQALSLFVEQHGRLPYKSEADELWQLAQEAWTLDDEAREKGNRLCQMFVSGCAAKFTPLQAVFGAIGAQEALKAATGLYFPTHQFLLYDCDEILDCAPEADGEKEDIDTPGSASGMKYILGANAVDRLESQRIFVVGAGAIGCELLKNLACMGIATKKKGRVCLTDMDTIEKSNLSRQLLFRDADIGKFKSAAAHEAALRFNSRMNIESHSSKVGGTEHSPFDENFWSNKVDIVLNALDNVEARLYMDEQCVANQKALIDAGTMGPKGNVQVVVPYQSESYSSSADPPEPAIPLCTLKQFPYAISHTIQWGKDLFDGLYERRPIQANDFIDSLQHSSLEKVCLNLVREKGEDSAVQTAKELSEDLRMANGSFKDDTQAIKENSLNWAVRLASELFVESTENLLNQHPLDSLDEDGEPFWSGTRRPPKILAYRVSEEGDIEQGKVNKILVDFVRAAAWLRMETIYGDSRVGEGSTLFSSEEVEAFLRSVSDSGTCPLEDERSTDSNISLIEHLRAHLDGISSGNRRLVSIEFEKDDESNGHVAFVNAASNLRAIAYGIPPVDAMETRRVAGNIVPAMITTTAFVSALSCIELVKLVQKASLRLHRNAFINLALPFFAFTAPLPAEEKAGLHGKRYTLWDRLSVKEGKKTAASGGLTMRSLLRRIKKQVSDKPDTVDVSSISFGPYMLFANFLHEEDESVLGASLWQLAADAVAASEDFESTFSRNGEEETHSVNVENENFIDLSVVVEDLETGEEVEIPPVRVKRHKE